MSYPYVCYADVEKRFDENGFSMIEMPLDRDFKEIQHYGIKFYRCNLKAGHVVNPKLDPEKMVLLIFNGKRAYISAGDEKFYVDEPAFFIPDFDKCAYSVGAVDDVEFIMGVFNMNDWDKAQFVHWHKHLPFFKRYSDGTQYDQSCKMPGTRSWSILQGMMLGHVTIGVVHAIGSGTDEKGHPAVHQWNYCLGNSDFDLDVEGELAPQHAGDFSFIFGGRDHKLIGKPGKEVFYVWVEYYSEDDLTEFDWSSCHNESPSEAYNRILEKRKAQE